MCMFCRHSVHTLGLAYNLAEMSYVAAVMSVCACVQVQQTPLVVLAPQELLGGAPLGSPLPPPPPLASPQVTVNLAEHIQSCNTVV